MNFQQMNSRTTGRFFARVCLLGLIAVLSGCGAGEKVESDNKQTAEVTADAPPSLQARLDSLKARSLEQLPPEMAADFESGVLAVAATGVLETALSEGDRAPDFTLPGATGDSVTLSDLTADGPVVLVWYRGGWCPYCNLQLRAMQDVLEQIHAAGARLVAISPEIPDSSLSTRERDSLQFHVLSDFGNEVAREYGIVYKLPDEVRKHFEGRLELPEYNGDDSWELPLAATFIVGRDNIVRYAFVEADYKVRAEPAHIIEVLRSLQDEKRI
jgi:peroxiredoxin